MGTKWNTKICKVNIIEFLEEPRNASLKIQCRVGPAMQSCKKTWITKISTAGPQGL